MHSSKKVEQIYLDMKAHIGAYADTGLVHTVRGTSGKVHDVTQGNSVLHGEEALTFCDARYQGADKRVDALTDQTEKLKAGIRAKVEHPFRVIKRQLDYMKARQRGLKKNTAQLITLFALCNLWMVRSKLMGGTGMSVPKIWAKPLQSMKTALLSRENDAVWSVGW